MRLTKVRSARDKNQPVHVRNITYSKRKRATPFEVCEQSHLSNLWCAQAAESLTSAATSAHFDTQSGYPSAVRGKEIAIRLRRDHVGQVCVEHSH